MTIPRIRDLKTGLIDIRRPNEAHLSAKPNRAQPATAFLLGNHQPGGLLAL